ncbi:MAG: KEOPS complex subunit Pcc1 [Candidatus Micrarchaeia archaeon]
MKCIKGKCRIELKFDSEADANAAHAALKQEEEFKKRSDSRVSVSGKSLSVDIDGEDVVALRATANSYLRALQAIESVGSSVVCSGCKKDDDNNE